MDARKCGRPNCKNTEYRIDGYCSIYCRDIHDLEVQLEASQQELAEIKERIVPTEEEAYHTLHDYEDLWAMERKYADDKKPGSDTWKLLRTINLAWSHNYEIIKDNADLRKQLAASQTEVKRLEDLCNTDRVKYLEDITLLQAEVVQLHGKLKKITDDSDKWAEIIKESYG